MRLLYTPTSPYARKVRVCLLEKGLPVELVVVNSPRDAEVGQANPLGKVPVLVRADGTAVYDSRVIVQLVEALAPSPAMFPADPLLRVEVLRWEALCDGVCDAVVARMIESRQASPDAGFMAHQEGKVRAGLAAIERGLGAGWLFGDFGLADVSVATAIGYVGLRAAEILAEHPALVARYATLCERASIGQTRPG